MIGRPNRKWLRLGLYCFLCLTSLLIDSLSPSSKALFCSSVLKLPSEVKESPVTPHSDREVASKGTGDSVALVGVGRYAIGAIEQIDRSWGDYPVATNRGGWA